MTLNVLNNCNSQNGISVFAQGKKDLTFPPFGVPVDLKIWKSTWTEFYVGSVFTFKNADKLLKIYSVFRDAALRGQIIQHAISRRGLPKPVGSWLLAAGAIGGGNVSLLCFCFDSLLFLNFLKGSQWDANILGILSHCFHIILFFHC